jgi:hypothetical protein
MVTLSRKQGIIIYPTVALVILTFVLYLPNMLGYPVLTVFENTTILLTFAIAIFAMIQGYSAFIQVEMQGKTNKIENARNELEKAYGPIFSLLNNDIKLPEKDDKIVRLEPNDKLELDKIMFTYPFMFEKTMNEFWQANIRKLEPKKYTKSIPTLGSWATEVREGKCYEIPFEFLALFNKEYEMKRKNLDNLLKDEI